jgi:hypothetical protein
MRAIGWAVCAASALGVTACGHGSSETASAPASSEARAPASQVSLTVSRSEIGKHDRFGVAITTRHPTGVNGRTRSSYTLAAMAVRPAVACVNNRDRGFPDRPRGGRVRAELDPARGKGGSLGWCPGRYNGTVTYVKGFACPAKGRCHIPAGFPTRTQIVARFWFRVR